MRVEQYLLGDEIDKTSTNEEATPIYISSTLADIIIESNEFINNYSDIINTTITRTYGLISEQLEIKNIIYTSDKKKIMLKENTQIHTVELTKGLANTLIKLLDNQLFFF